MKALSRSAGAELASEGRAPGFSGPQADLGCVRDLCRGPGTQGPPEEFHLPEIFKSVTLFTTQTDIEITREEDFTRILQMEEEYIQQLCEDIIHLKPDVVITEKGISGGTPFAFHPPVEQRRVGWTFPSLWRRQHSKPVMV